MHHYCERYTGRNCVCRKKYHGYFWNTRSLGKSHINMQGPLMTRSDAMWSISFERPSLSTAFFVHESLHGDLTQGNQAEVH
ncbi:unnamed protein product [Arctogadus glacialis]